MTVYQEICAAVAQFQGKRIQPEVLAQLREKLVEVVRRLALARREEPRKWDLVVEIDRTRSLRVIVRDALGREIDLSKVESGEWSRGWREALAKFAKRALSEDE